MYVTFDATKVFSGKPNIRDHIAVFKANLNILRDAMAIAVALNRTLALPPLPCHCDKVWGGHDNIFTFQCHYPGSAEEKYLPSSCPLDHFISPTLTRLRKSGFKFTPLASLSSTTRSEAVTIEGFTGANTTVDAVDAFVSASSASRATLINLGGNIEASTSPSPVKTSVRALMRTPKPSFPRCGARNATHKGVRI